jgi:hypothetical protein
MINYTTEDKNARLVLEGLAKKGALRLTKKYITSGKAGDDIKPYALSEKERKAMVNNETNVSVPARSITTFVFE